MKKILMFQDYFYMGGIEKVISDIKNNLNILYDIDILSFVNKSNYNIISLLNKDYKNFLIRNILGIYKLNKYLKNNKYDIIHIHCYNSFGLIYAILSYKYNKNIIIHAHNSNIDKDYLYIKHIINNIIKFIFKSNKYKYVAVSESCNKFCFNNKNCLIIPNGVDYSKYKFKNIDRIKYRKLFNIKDSDIVIGQIGRFEIQKNHEFIINLFSKLKNNYKLILIGEGSLKEKIICQINELNLDSRVIILDNRNDINKLINMFDIFVFPSFYEGFPLCLIENQINGKYVFASNNIDKCTKISNRIKYLDLDINIWVNEIENIKENKFKLDNNLDIKEYINKIKDIYEKS